jgi:hypothetical protein
VTDINNFDDLYPGRFLKAGMFNGQPVTYTIENVQHDEIEGDKGAEKKVVLSFRETPFELVLPKINAVAIKAMFGPQVQEWIGKRVTLYGTTAIMPFPKKKDEPCIRVFGSPDIAAEVRCEWTPPRRKVVVQILKPMQSPVLTAALAAIAAAPDGAPMGKLQERANQLLVEKKINDTEHATISQAIQERIGARADGAAPAVDTAADASQLPPGGHDTAPDGVHEAAAAPAGIAPPTDGPGEPAEPDPAAGSSAVEVELKLRDRQQLIRSVNALAPERKTALMASLRERFNIDSPSQLKSQAHSDHAIQFLKVQ